MTIPNSPHAGRVVIVTGASSGIGVGIARAFCIHGARVVIAARSHDRLEGVRDTLSAEGHEVDAVVADVAQRASVLAMVDAVVARHGRIDVLCANAGIYPMGMLDDLSLQDWDDTMAVNARGSFLCVQACLPHLRKSHDGGRIVLTSSITGPITAIPALSHYGASKAAQLGFMRGAALEMAKDGITINAVLPGTIETDALRVLGDAYLRSATRLVPAKRLGTVDDIANAVLFFAQPSSGFVTAQSLVVDGGQIIPETPEAVP